jgi:uncharacterized membrane protein HdeD (DUF308 family)
MWTRVLLVLLGVVALIWSVDILGFMVYFFAFIAIIGSIGTLAVGVSYSKEQLHAPRWAILILGILGLIIGLATVASPAFMTVAIIYFMGSWALVTGVADLVHAFSRVPAGNPRLIMVVSGIVSVLFPGNLRHPHRALGRGIQHDFTCRGSCDHGRSLNFY